MLSPKRDRKNLKWQLEVAATLTMSHPVQFPRDPYATKSITEDEIKEIMRKFPQICSVCQQYEPEVKTYKWCSGCKSQLYCSRECQKKDWRQHKPICRPDVRKVRLRELTLNLTTDFTFSAFIEIATVLHIGLSTSSSDKPFCVGVHLGIEPEDILDFARLRGDIDAIPESATKVRKKHKGMLQINNIFTCPEELLGGRETLLSLVNSAKEDAIKDRFYAPKLPTGVMAFFLGDSFKILKAPVVIHPVYMDMAMRRQPFKLRIPATGATVTQPMSTQSCIQYINTSIRLDKFDDFSLRTDMMPEDELIIRNSAGDAYEQDSDGLEHLRIRMVSEYVYRVLLGLEQPGAVVLRKKPTEPVEDKASSSYFHVPRN
ncbi:hypothetical protein BDN70DRAFT_992901 [Pholiota conissans]|uniref:MYND-type domain-containing protein n=1 Tax=Pholiota conissans TaxID=109636 RepID=A0A9P6D1G1_9AGAR|nr:hypothetical protein BDN70DRAFT_992901 [Pholiota conissans]